MSLNLEMLINRGAFVLGIAGATLKRRNGLAWRSARSLGAGQSGDGVFREAGNRSEAEIDGPKGSLAGVSEANQTIPREPVSSKGGCRGCGPVLGPTFETQRSWKACQPEDDG